MNSNLPYSVRFLSLFFIWCRPVSATAQEDPAAIYRHIHLDSVVITAERGGFDVLDFIELVLRDTSFYEAFRNLRFASYSFENKLVILDKSRQEKAGYRSLAHQVYDSSCRQMKEEQRLVSGPFLDPKGDYRFYTAKLYDRLFFTHGKICHPAPADVQDTRSKGMEKHVEELKTLIFSPGKIARVPLLGNKTAIFEKEMMAYYDYRISADSLSHRPCYKFSVEAKPQFLHSPRTVIKQLHTWFEKGSLKVVRRTYTLQAKTLLYQFKVDMKIDVNQTAGKYYPTAIDYEGRWKVVSKKAEDALFRIRFSEFKPGES
ncbi:MAG TPA: hypothetical protein PKL70_16690 [Saprospiraceae bacterium]|nr:hypothetical protein [Saprospiraceae bacterium]